MRGRQFNKHPTPYITRIMRPDFHMTVLPFAHCNCSWNQFRAIVQRVVKEVPLPTLEGVSALQMTTGKILSVVKKYHLVKPRLNMSEVCNCYVGRKRRDYIRAMENVCSKKLTKRYLTYISRITAFVKLEKLPPKHEDPAPRMIQARTKEFNVLLGQWTKPIEDMLKQLPAKLLVKSAVGVLVGKGLSARQRGQAIVDKWNNFKHPAVISLDCSRFDLHCSWRLLTVEHMFYNGLYKSKLLRRLLNKQLENVCTCTSPRGIKGIRYKTIGGRMSGDMNTALGNCYLMITMCVTAMQNLDIDTYDILDDGDDCLLFLELDGRMEGWLSETKVSLREQFLTFGHELRVVDECLELHQIDWCQSRVLPTSYGWTLVRNPAKVLSTALVSAKFNIKNVKFRRRLARAIGNSELSMNSGIPILQEFALMILRNAGDVEPLFLDDGLRIRYALQLKDSQPPIARPIDKATREAFYLSFGIDIRTQLEYEHHLSGCKLRWDGDIECWERNSSDTRIAADYHDVY